MLILSLKKVILGRKARDFDWTHQSISDGHQFVSNDKTTVHLGGTALHNFRYVDSIVTGYMLIANTAGDTETEALVSLD